MVNEQEYYDHPFVSNSKLSEFQKQLEGRDYIDLQDAFRMGALVDAFITTPHLVDFLRYEIIGREYKFTPDEFKLAKNMRDSFLKDSFCGSLVKKSDFQVAYKKINLPFYYNGVDFSLNTKCLYDIDDKVAQIGADVKSTNCTTLESFIVACKRFGYFRSRYFYMRNSGYEKDLIIGVSKKYPHKIFKVFVTSYYDPESPQSYDNYEYGMAECHELAYKYWALNNNL